MTAVKAFVTNLGKYNEGFLVGEWVDFPITPEQEVELLERIGIDNVYYEEIFMTDYESDLGLDLYGAFGEYPSIDKLNEVAELFENMTDYETKVFAACCEADSYWLKNFEEFDPNNWGLAEGLTAVEYEERLFYDTISREMSELLDNNSYIRIDFEAMARDDYTITETSYGVLYEC